jgi:hypothetical protein
MPHPPLIEGFSIVKQILGHKSINSTLLYAQLVNFDEDEYDVKVAESKKEIKSC